MTTRPAKFIYIGGVRSGEYFTTSCSEIWMLPQDFGGYRLVQAISLPHGGPIVAVYSWIDPLHQIACYNRIMAQNCGSYIMQAQDFAVGWNNFIEYSSRINPILTQPIEELAFHAVVDRLHSQSKLQARRREKPGT